VNKDNIITTIVFRSGSKGCPGKHTREMAGKPLFMWTLEQAIEFGARIIIATDIKHEIKPIVPKDIPVVLQRPEPTDRTPKLPAVRGAAEDAEHHYGQKFPIILDLDATAPLRAQVDIEDAIRILEEDGNADCVLSATVGVGRNPYFNLLEFRRGRLDRSKPLQFVVSTRQQAPTTVFAANSSIYAYRRKFLFDENVTSPLDGKCAVLNMPEESYYHVDSELDFEIVEFLMKRRLGQASEVEGVPEPFRMPKIPRTPTIMEEQLKAMGTISNQIQAIHKELKRV